MNEIKIYLKPSGSIAELYKDFELYEGCYRNSQLTVFVPKSLLYENENGTFVNLVKTGAILTAPNGSKLTTKSYYLDYERDQTIGGVEFRVYTTITPKEFCVYAGTQTVVVNVESIDNTTPDAQTIISVTTTQTADLIVLESAYLGQDEPIDPTELDKIKATLSEIQSEIGGLPNKYVTVDTNQTISGNKTHTGINVFTGFTSISGIGIDADAIVKGSDRFKYPVKSGTLALTSDIPENIVTKDENGQIKVPLAPAQDDDAVSKKYVDDADNTKLNKVEPFANGTYAYIVSKDDRFGTTNGYTEISEKDKISTIAKRKTNGCIETRTPYADIEAANKGYVDTAISDTQSQLAQTNQNVEDLYTILEQAQVVTVTTLEQAYTTRETADGENIVDGIDTSVKEIRGKTVAPTNLIPFPYAEASQTKNGVTFTVNELDGSIVLSGVSTSAASFGLTSPTFHLPAGTYFFSLNSNKALSDSTIFGIANKFQNGSFVGDVATDYGIGDSFSVSASDISSNSGYRLEIFVRGVGVNCDGYIFYPMLNAGSSALPYKPYFKGLKNASFEKIVSTGRNLIPYPYEESTKTENGITFTVNSDGSITANGTTTVNPSIFNVAKISLNAGTYALRSFVNVANAGICQFYIDIPSEPNDRTGNGVTFTLQDDIVNKNVNIIVNPSQTVNNLIFKPMLQFGTTATAYEPYTSDTLSVKTPIELAEYDVAYPETGETKRNSGKKVFDGTETWEARGSAGDLYRYGAVLANVKTNGACVANLSGENSGASVAGNYFIDTEFKVFTNIATVDEWKAHLAEIATAGNPLTVIYETAEATTEATPFNKSKYIARKNGSETIEQGANDNSEYGAENTVKQDYFTLTGGTTNV